MYSLALNPFYPLLVLLFLLLITILNFMLLSFLSRYNVLFCLYFPVSPSHSPYTPPPRPPPPKPILLKGIFIAFQTLRTHYHSDSVSVATEHISLPSLWISFSTRLATSPPRINFSWNTSVKFYPFLRCWVLPSSTPSLAPASVILWVCLKPSLPASTVSNIFFHTFYVKLEIFTFYKYYMYLLCLMIIMILLRPMAYITKSAYLRRQKLMLFIFIIFLLRICIIYSHNLFLLYHTYFLFILILSIADFFICIQS